MVGEDCNPQGHTVCAQQFLCDAIAKAQNIEVGHAAACPYTLAH